MTDPMTILSVIVTGLLAAVPVLFGMLVRNYKEVKSTSIRCEKRARKMFVWMVRADEEMRDMDEMLEMIANCEVSACKYSAVSRARKPRRKLPDNFDQWMDEPEEVDA